MAEHAARIRLDRDAGPDDRVRVAELADDAVGVEAAAVAEDLEEAPRRIERVLAAGEALAASSAATTPFCAARPTCSGLVIVPKLTRMPEAELAAIASACAVWLGVEAQQLRGRGHRAERADGAGGVEALLVVVGMDRLGDLALDLEAGQEGFEELPPVTPLPLADRQRRGQRRHRRMRQQPEDAVGARRQLRVVPVERVAARAVEQRR